MFSRIFHCYYLVPLESMLVLRFPVSAQSDFLNLLILYDYLGTTFGPFIFQTYRIK